MRGFIQRHLTYANVTATMAVFIALGGTSYAAVQLANNSVRSKHIVNGQVKGADLDNGIPYGLALKGPTKETSSDDKTVRVKCPEGQYGLSGGAWIEGAKGLVALTESRQAFGPFIVDFTGWQASAIEVNGGTGQDWTLHVFAICGRVKS